MAGKPKKQKDDEFKPLEDEDDAAGSDPKEPDEFEDDEEDEWTDGLPEEEAY